MSFLKSKFLYVLIIGFFVSSCDDMELCFYEDDFGEIANRDSFYIYSSENNCFFNQTIEHSDTTQSYIVQQCIRNTKLSTIKNSNKDELEKYFNIIENFGATVSDGATCAQADPYIISNKITPDTIDTQSARQFIYSECVNYCTQQCAEEGTTLSTKWTSANLKSDSNYLGIRLSEDSYVYITVSGSVVLQPESDDNKSRYSIIGLNDVNYATTILGGDYLNLTIDYNKEHVKSLFENDVNNLKARTVITLKNINNDLVVNNNYTYQQPQYKNFQCNYTNNNENITKSCKFNIDIPNDTSNISNTINKYYNNNYIFSIFNNSYQEYVSDITNNINYIDPLNGNVVNNSDAITVWNQEYISYKNNQTNFEYIDSYILSKGTNSISFDVNRPVKLAIRYVGTTTNATGIACNFNITDENNYKLGVDNKVINENIVYKDIKYSAISLSSTNNTNKWQVLKTSSGNEIIFNQFSTPNKKIDSKIELSLNVNNSHQDCSSGFLIKLIPLVDYEITKTGLLFLDFVGTTASDVDIKYNIINTNALYQSSLNKEEYRLNDFYESGKTAYYGGDENNAWKTVKSVNAINIDNIDLNNFDIALLQKSIFVRQGQVIRFDYSNWMELDNAERISKKYDSLSGVNIDRALSIHAYIKERPAYFCVGSAEETLDIRSKCLSSNGEYKTMYVDNTTNIEEKCYIKNQKCMITNQLIDEYDNIDDSREDCKPIYVIPFDSEIKHTTNISDFWNAVYTSYANSERQSCYDTMISKIYKIAQECRSNISVGYEVYKGVIENGVESYVSKVNSMTELNDVTITPNDRTDTEAMVTNLNSFFGTIQINNNSSEQTEEEKNYVTHKSPFYYFKSICIPKDDGMCYAEATPMCYDLTYYNGSTINFINRTLNNDKSSKTSNIEHYGMMNKDDVLFGAKRISNFNGSSGIMKNFIEDLTVKEVDEGYSRLRYETLIYINKYSALEVYMLNTPDIISVNSSDLYKFFTKNTLNTPVLQLNSFVKKTYKNGANLSIMIGENSKKYYSKTNGTIYYSDNGGISENIVSESLDGSNDNGSKILHIIKYDNNGTVSESNMYAFNEKGELVEKINKDVVGIDFKNFAKGSAYIGSNDGSTKNLFFKIADTDGKSENNEGKYKIVLKEFNQSDSGIIKYFRNFFNAILHFVDGKYIYLQTYNNSYASCTAETLGDDVCYIYNEDDVSKNGDACTKDYEHCYSACDIESGLKQNCKAVYNGKGFVKTIYETFINDPLYIFMAKMLLVLSITWYGFGYFLGMSDFKQSEIIMKIIKMCFIYFLISPSGWSFFNDFVIKFFKDCIDSVLFLIAGSFEVNLDSELTRAINGHNYSDKTLLFSGCFTNLEMIFSDTIFNKMLGLAFSSWVGLIYLYLVFSAVISYVISVFTAMILYLSAQVYISLVFCFFPIVILFMFFKKTEKTFDNWLGLLIGFAGQQIFLIMTLSFFNLLVYNFVRNTFSYTVCWLPLLNMSIGGLPFAAIQFWKIPGTTMSSTGLNTGNEAMPSFYGIITFYMVGVLMGKFITEMVSIGSGIFGGSSIKGQIAGNVIGKLEKAGDGFRDKMKSTGKGFAKGIASRFGGAQLKEFNEEQKKQIQERREKRNEHFKAVNEKTEQDMEEYRKSDEFKEDSVKEAKKSEFEKIVSKDSKEQDVKQQMINNNIITEINNNKKERLNNSKEYDSLNKEVGEILQKKEAGTITKEEDEQLGEKLERLNYLKDNKLTDEEYQQYTEATKSNEEIEKRNTMRQQHEENLAIIQQAQSDDATEEDKQKAEEAIKNEESLADKNYEMLSDEQKQVAEKTGQSAVLKNKQQEFTHNNAVDDLMKRYGGDITSSMKHRGISEEQWKSMKKDKQRELVEQWGIERGLVNK